MPTAPLQSLFVFDIETVPDTDVAFELTGCLSDDPIEQAKALEDYHLKITDGKNSFLRQPFHKVVAISFLEANIIRHPDGTESYELTDLRSGGKIDDEEEVLIRGFFAHLGKRCPRLVSFNGRTFDLPVLKYRAMKYGISAPWLFNSGDKWENYNKKWSLEWHCDLIDAYSDFGSSARIKMNEACSIFDFPGKVGIDGGDVFSMYLNQKQLEIRQYCETDVINTYLLYLRYHLFCGKINISSYNQSINDMLVYIKDNSDEHPHFKEFYDSWHKVCAGNFTIS